MEVVVAGRQEIRSASFVTAAPQPLSVILTDGNRRELTASQAAQVALVLADDEMLSPADAARLLAVSRPMVVRWINEGVLPDSPIGAHHRVPKVAVLELKERRRRVSAAAMAEIDAAKTDPAAARRTAAARAAAALKAAELNS
jgi:excisionase family DNA binding protein